VQKSKPKTLLSHHLHIISFDIPWPADYGGVIDVYYKVKALFAEGIKVHLHCFAYGRPIAPQLDEVCHEVHYYQRNMNRSLLTHPLPFIVVSRQHTSLFKRLMADEYPILFEGKHSCYYLDHPDLLGRKRYVRTHNEESAYYAGLAAAEKKVLKKWYLKREAKKLGRFKENLKKADGLISISPKDVEAFSSVNDQVHFIPPFHSGEQVYFQEEKSDYALYHGNLTVAENHEAAQWLIDDVFVDEKYPLKIFGARCPNALKKAIAQKSHIELIEKGDLEELVRNARINVLPTFQATGMKLKLLYSLYNGGHVLVNSPMVKQTGLEDQCTIADSAQEMRAELKRLWTQAYSKSSADQRNKLLNDRFSNQANACQLIDIIFEKE